MYVPFIYIRMVPYGYLAHWNSDCGCIWHKALVSSSGTLVHTRIGRRQ